MVRDILSVENPLAPLVFFCLMLLSAQCFLMSKMLQLDQSVSHIDGVT